MRTENEVCLRDKPLEAHVVVVFLVGVDNVELRHVVALEVCKARAIRNLPEGRGKCQRVATEFGSASVGNVFTFARNGEARERTEQVPDRCPHEGDKQHQDYPCAGAIVLAAGAAWRSADRRIQRPENHLHRHRENPDKNDAHHHQARIAVLDVREFVPHHSRKFCIV